MVVYLYDSYRFFQGPALYYVMKKETGGGRIMRLFGITRLRC